MIVHLNDIEKYIRDNQGVYSVTLPDGGVERVTYNDRKAQLEVEYLSGHFTRNYIDHAIFSQDLGDGSWHEVKLKFDPVFIDAIKEDLLHCAITDQIIGLSEAAIDMDDHYRGVAKNKGYPEARPAENIHLQVYVLKKIDYEQPGKGHVLISPFVLPLQVTGDVIKGYIYDQEQGTIKYETVQAWRYRHLKRYDIPGSRLHALLKKVGWFDLMAH